MLTHRQQLFVNEYLIDKNALQAALRAGYSEASSYKQSYLLMHNPEVRFAIEEALGEQFERLKFTADDVIAEISRVAFASVKHIYDRGGDLKNITDIDPDTAAAIASIETETQGGMDGDAPVTTKKVKLLDKVKALDMLAKHFNLYEQDNKSKAAVIEIGYGKEED